MVVKTTEPQPWGIRLETRQNKVVLSSLTRNTAGAGVTVGIVPMSVAGVRVYDSSSCLEQLPCLHCSVSTRRPQVVCPSAIWMDSDDSQIEAQPEQLPFPRK